MAWYQLIPICGQPQNIQSFTVLVPEGTTDLVVSLQTSQITTEYQFFANPSWNTAIVQVVKGLTTVTVTFATPAGPNARMDVLVIS